MRQRRRRQQEVGFDRPAQLLLGLPDVLDAQRRTVRLEGVLLGRAVADMRAHQDQRRSRGVGAGCVQRGVDRRQVVAIGHVDGLPAVGLEALRAVLREGDVGAGGQRHVVVVVQADQLAELEMAGQRGRFAGHALHQVAVADDRPGAMVDHRMAVAVVARRQVRLADRHADRVRQALAERAGGDFDARRVAVLGMSRRLAAPLAELLEVVQREVVAGDEQQAVQQCRAVAGGEHETVAVGPVRIAPGCASAAASTARTPSARRPAAGRGGRCSPSAPCPPTGTAACRCIAGRGRGTWRYLRYGGRCL